MDALGWVGRADTVLDPMGDDTLKLGFSGLGVLDRGTGGREREGGATLELMLLFKPTLEGVLIRVPGVRPRTGIPSMAGS